MNPSYSLEASNLLADKDISKGKELILNAILKHSSNLTTIRPPISDLKQEYQETLQEFSKLRGANLLYPYLGSGIGNGPLVELIDGSVKYDFITGIGVHFFGHSNSKLIETCLDAACSDITIQGHLQQNIDSMGLLKILTSLSHLPHCFLTTSGSMAVENSLKIALQKQFPANRILAFERCFSGRSYMLAQISDKPYLRDQLPMTYPVDYIPFYDPKEPEESTKRALGALNKIIARYPKQHALMLFELVQGEGGCYPGSKDFFVSLMSLLREHGIAIVVDEVQTFGRLPEIFAFQYYGLEEFVDVCALGKLSFVCATLFSERFTPKQGLLGQTFTSTTSSIRCSTEILKMLLHGGFYGPQGKIAVLGGYFKNKLKQLEARKTELLCDITGVGGMIAFTPFGGNKQKISQFLNNLFHAGVIAFSAGQNPLRVRFLPPMGIITEKDIDNVMEIVEKTLIEGI